MVCCSYAYAHVAFIPSEDIKRNNTFVLVMLVVRLMFLPLLSPLAYVSACVSGDIPISVQLRTSIWAR